MVLTFILYKYEDYFGKQICALNIYTGWGRAEKLVVDMHYLRWAPSIIYYCKPSVSKKVVVDYWTNGPMNNLKVIEMDIIDAKKEMLKVKNSATKITLLKKVQVKAGLFA